MLQSGALAAEDIRWLWGLGNVWETVIVCSNSSKALAHPDNMYTDGVAPNENTLDEAVREPN